MSRDLVRDGPVFLETGDRWPSGGCFNLWMTTLWFPGLFFKVHAVYQITDKEVGIEQSKWRS